MKFSIKLLVVSFFCIAAHAFARAKALRIATYNIWNSVFEEKYELF